MGDKSEAFCRQTPPLVLAQIPEVLPASFDLAEAQNDLTQLDRLRRRLHRLVRLDAKGVGADTALGSNIMSACLGGDALLKVTGKGAGLEALRQRRCLHGVQAPLGPGVREVSTGLAPGR